MPSQEELMQEWVQLAPAWVRESREGLNSNRTGLLDAPVLAGCGDIEGCHALDMGCGEGRFSRMLSERGAARVLGIDLCPAMIEAARELEGDRDEYRVADAQHLPSLDSASFDLVVSYLNQCDLDDFIGNTEEAFRLLRPGGRFVVANLHPMRSAVGHWHKSESGQKLHVVLDDYFDEGARRWRMMGVDFTNFHRTLTTYVRAFLNAGFVLTDLVEPTVSADVLDRHPALEDELRVPNFIVYVLTKPQPR